MAKVIKRFKCKLTKQSYAPGQSYEANPGRIEFLQRAGYLEGAPLSTNDEPKTDPTLELEQESGLETKEEAVSEPEVSAKADRNEYQLSTKKELKKELDKRGIDYNKRQTKQELIDLLVK